jgi:hypothetical protein
MNTPVSLELSKLLKEKGYPFELITVGEIKEVPLNIPTVAEVVMWLYEKHGIWIVPEPFVKQEWETLTYIYKIYKNGYVDTVSRAFLSFNSPTEAYVAAIEYTLKNLI